MHRVLSIFLALVTTSWLWSLGDDGRAQVALDLAEAINRNRELLRRCTWKSKSEISVGSSQVVLLEKVEFNAKRKRLGGARRASSAVEEARAKKYSEKFRELALRYTAPTSARLVDFLGRASFRPGTGNRKGSFEITGRGFIDANDSVRIRVESETNRPFKYFFGTVFEGSSAAGEVDFSQVKGGGPWYVSRVLIKIPAKSIKGTLVNYDVEYARPVTPTGTGEEGQGDWPREFTGAGGTLIVYQPQVEEWKNKRQLIASAAVSVKPKGGEETFGALELHARTSVHFDTRTVLIERIQLEELVFRDLDDATTKKVETACRKIFPKHPLTLSLDRLLAAVKKEEERESDLEISVEPPEIIVGSEPASLVMVEGEPMLDAIEGTSLELVLNTEWDLFKHTGSSKFYLVVNETWFVGDGLPGPWRVTGDLPADFGKLPDVARFKETNKLVARAAAGVGAKEVPKKIYVRTAPAELIVIEGEPKFSPIRDTKLFEILNTESDLFFHHRESKFYFLAAGRWFRAESLKGPWTFCGADLPRDFQKIPDDHRRSYLLASVPGTEDAAEALLMTQIPRTATVSLNSPKIDVTYDGDPEFVAIEGTDMLYAVNTAYAVIALDGHYYCCHDGVWFDSNSPLGPWSVCAKVPEEIYTIPASSPVHDVTYVKVYEVDEEEDEATYGYTGEYEGYYPYYGSVYYGLGWWYARRYHYYHHCHYGYRHPAAHYWAHRYHRFRHHRAYGRGAYYDRYTGRYNYHRYPGVHGRTLQPTVGHRGVYAAWGGRDVRPASRANVPAAARGRTVRRSGNVYAGQNGSVYRMHNGRWQRRSATGWQTVNRPGTTSRRGSTAKAGTKQRSSSSRSVQRRLEQHHRARKSGHQRVQRSRSQYQRSSATRRHAGTRGAVRRGGGRGRR